MRACIYFLYVKFFASHHHTDQHLYLQKVMLEFVFVLVFVGVTFIDRYLFFMHYHLREGFREESISGCSFRNVKIISRSH